MTLCVINQMQAPNHSILLQARLFTRSGKIEAIASTEM